MDAVSQIERKIFLSSQFTIFKEIQHCPGSLRHQAEGDINSMFFEDTALETDARRFKHTDDGRWESWLRMDSDEGAEKVPKSSIAHKVDSDDKSDERCKIM